MSHHRHPIITRMSQIAGIMSQNPDRPPQGLSFKPLGIAFNSDERAPTYNNMAAELHSMADEMERLINRSNTALNGQKSSTGRESGRGSSSAFDDLIQLSDALPERAKSTSDNKKAYERDSNARGKGSKVRFSFVEDGTEEEFAGEDSPQGLRGRPSSPGSASSTTSSSSSSPVGTGRSRSNVRSSPRTLRVPEEAAYPELSFRPTTPRSRKHESSSFPHVKTNSNRNRKSTRNESHSHSHSYTSQNPENSYYSSPHQTPLFPSHSSSSVGAPQPYYNQARTTYPGVAPPTPPTQPQQAQFQPRQRHFGAPEALAPPLLGQSTIFQFGPSTAATAPPPKKTPHADQFVDESAFGRSSSQYSQSHARSRSHSRSRSCSRSGSRYRPPPPSPSWQAPGSHSSLPPPPALSRNWN